MSYHLCVTAFLLGAVHMRFVVPKPVHENTQLNDRPIIGILAQTSYLNSSTCGSYIAASYVKYLESAGARVVPVFNNLTRDQALELFNQLNGVLFPGGGVDIFNSGYGRNAMVFLDHAIDGFYKNKDYFPVWGTCMGFETLAILTTDTVSVLEPCDGVDYSVPLNFAEGFNSSRMFSSAPDEIIKYLTTMNVTYNHHRECVTPDTFKRFDKLNEFFRVISTSQGLKGKTFISTYEAKDYPIYGVQWHPEKNAFEFPTEEHGITHSPESVSVTQYMSNFFVNEARKNFHKFKTPEAEKSALIYNFNPVYPAKESIGKFKNFEQVYCFP